MDIILTHINTDFDGLASVVAAHKLFPRARPVLPHKMGANVQEFMALHKDSLGFIPAKEVVAGKVRRIIMVDTKVASRVGPLGALLANPKVETYVYDHHPVGDDDVQANHLVREDVGATTTLLVEIIRRRHLPLSSFEATVLALGIYEDTGSLMFSTTTVRDVLAAAYLLEKGANLAVVAHFIDRPLCPEQKALLRAIGDRAMTLTVGGVRVVVTSAELDEYVEGLALLVHRQVEIEGSDVFIAVVRMEGRVYVVGRSRVEEVHVHELLRPFGGGGHSAAAAATIKGGNVKQILNQIVQQLQHTIHPLMGAREIMSSPVKTVTPATTVDEAGKVLLRYGHSGMPVLDGEKLVGVISRRDLDKAGLHGLRHAPVKGFMSRKVISIPPETTLAEIQRLMIEHDIGRLPVMEQGKLVGIVSRTDVLRMLHGESTPVQYRANFCSVPGGGANALRPEGSLRAQLEERLPPALWQLLQDVSELAERMNCGVYVVGGFVRDLLLKVNNLDIDLVVEGDGIAFATALAVQLGGRVKTHEKFGTAVVVWGQQKIDVATARREFYQYPAALPQVEASNLRQDLYRRDFTINALAICLNQRRFGELIDFFCGQRDLEQGFIRVLYNLSFVEDPTRILRAIRFEQRYGFQIEPETLLFAREAIARQMIKELSYDRLFAELVLILSEANPAPALRRITELGIWQYLMPELVWTERVESELLAVPPLLAAMDTAGLGLPARPWMVYLLVLTRRLRRESIEAVGTRYPLRQRLRQAMQTLAEMGDAVDECLSQWLEAPSPSQLESLLSGWILEATIALLVGRPPAEAIAIVRAWQQVQAVRPLLNGQDLQTLGLRPGPEFARILQQLRKARLDGQVHDRDDEWALVKQWLAEQASKKKPGGTHV
ncbi:tRNA nucleotidyltransferase (CCA-adding enzyme) [Heliophilum fasciatum]|uniref:tRNA nucleotidyltransferase (CCA-adding enzyme) n=1 Tax=Heliophilum fasciatum TaxID=35700 RepID=A0A4R2RXD0_9FIRM|nr:tRNA nucleotidyltransferase (CCA-adding enzyme) [Heliophilum fasciatum]